MKFVDQAVCSTATVVFDTVQFFNKYRPGRKLHSQVVRQAALEILAEDQAATGLAPPDRLPLPGVREGSARQDHEWR